ncbi:MAG: UbiA-like polyprenyltransferase [Rikenellaceae bacterium]
MKKYLSLVKFSHTIFALPFALIGFIYGIDKIGSFSLLDFALMLLCMVFARNTAMAFNRFADRDIDSLNPRTTSREIPSGQITERNALIFLIVNALLFIVTTYFLNTLAFYLSPVALFVICGYSLTKRFTSLCHLVLGVSLAIAPTGAYIAATSEFSLFAVMLSALVLFWVSAFDILYALNDEDFDREHSLHSIPQFFGRKGALTISLLLHLVAIAITILIGYLYLNTPLYYVGAAIFSLILIYEHIVVKPEDISRVNLAFATLNGTASILYAIFTIIAILWR